MQRRNFLQLASLPAVTALLSACGGSDSDSKPAIPDTQHEKVLEPGVDPATLSSVPPPSEIDLDFLLQTVDVPLRASVMMGEQPLSNIPVDFYDLDGQLLATVTTDAQGLARSDLSARRLVLAEAQTPDGSLLGLCYYTGLEWQATVRVDILQTLVVEAIAEAADQHHVGLYALQDYFRVPQSVNLLAVGHAWPLLDQRLMHAEWRSSGKSLAGYISELIADIFDHLDDDSYANTRFNAQVQSDKHSNLRLHAEPPRLQAKSAGSLGISREAAIDIIGNLARDGIKKAIPIPFASDVFGFAFGQFRSKVFPVPEGPDPYAPILDALFLVQSQLADIKEESQRQFLESSWRHLMKPFDMFENVSKELLNVSEEKGSNQARVAAYERQLISLTDGNETQRNQLKIATRMLVGSGNYVQTPIIQALLTVVRKKFYSEISREKYQQYLACFLIQQSIAHMLLAASYILRGYNEQWPESAIGDSLSMVLDDFERMFRVTHALYSVKALPPRVNIEHEKGLAWAGTCSLIPQITDLWPQSKKVCPSTYCSDNSFYRTGTGLPNWAGPEPWRFARGGNMMMSLEAWNFAPWRSPTKAEVSNAFYDGANRARPKLRVDVYAQSVGYASHTDAQGRQVNPFLLPSGKRVTIPTSFRRAGGGLFSGPEYLDITAFDMETMQVASRDVAYRYAHGEQYHYFPVATVSTATLRTHLPWLVVEDVLQQYRADIDRI